MKPLDPFTFGSSRAAQDLSAQIETPLQARSCARFLSQTHEVLAALEEMPDTKSALFFLPIFRAERLSHVDRLEHLEPVGTFVKNLVTASFREAMKRLKTRT